MKTLHYIILIVFLTILFSFKNSDPENVTADNLCEIIKLKTHKLTLHNFNPDHHDKVKYKNLNRLESNIYHRLFSQEMSEVDSSYFFGYFNISNSRIGLVCFNISAECDQRVEFFTLSVIDSCSSVTLDHYISSKDHHGIMYVRNSEISKDFKTLTITLKRTSEWVDEDIYKDTLFTDTFKFNLLKTNGDTTSMTQKFELIEK